MCAFDNQSIFREQLHFNLDQLIYRYNRLRDVNKTSQVDQKEFLMVLDSFLVLFRSMFLERGQHNFTMQNHFRKKNLSHVADEIDNYLDGIFGCFGISIRKAFKLIIDQFICHLDNVSAIQLGYVNVLSSSFLNPYAEPNLETIVTDLIEILNKGFQLELSALKSLYKDESEEK